MTTTTQYGTWQQYGDQFNLTVEDSVAAALSPDHAPDFDVPAIVEEYRKAINAGLPDGVTLNGDLFFGPASPKDPVRALEGPGFSTVVKEVLDAIAFWEIAERHRR